MTTIGVFWQCSPTYGHRRREARNLHVERWQDDLTQISRPIYALELDEAPRRQSTYQTRWPNWKPRSAISRTALDQALVPDGKTNESRS